MKEARRVFREFQNTSLGYFLYRMLKFSPVAYYGILALYCVVLAVMGRELIPPIAVLPYVYSFVGPAILLFVSQTIGYIAAYIYRNPKFRIEGCGSFLTIVYAILFGVLPMMFWLNNTIEQPFLFQRTDMVFLTLSLWDVSARMLFSAYWGMLDEQLVFNWLKKMNKVASDGIMAQILIVTFIPLLWFIFDIIYKDSNTRAGLMWLTLSYIFNAGLRWIFIRPQIPRRSQYFFKRKTMSGGYVDRLVRYSRRDERVENMRDDSEEIDWDNDMI